MKRKIVIISIISLLIGIFLGIKLNMLNANSNKEQNSQDNNSQEKTRPDFLARTEYINAQDGWVYGLTIYDKGLGHDYYLDGFNLKYKEIDGYSLKVRDKVTGEILGTASTNFISLRLNDDAKAELDYINEYLNSKQFDGEITIEDINDLNTKYIDKTLLVELYNKTLKKDYNVYGKYSNNPVVGRESVLSTNEDLKGEWEAFYVIRCGEIYRLNIELILEDGTPLSNLRETLDSKKIELLDKVDELEKEILKSQKVEIKSSNYDADLVNLIQTLHNSLEE